MHWCAVGSAGGTDPWRAGAEAAAAALEGRDAQLLLVFAGESLAGDELLAGVGDVSGEAQTIGCSAAAVIGCGEVSTDHVVVMALGGPGLHAITAAAAPSLDPRTAGREIASRLAPAVAALPSLGILLSAARTGNQDELVRGAYGVLGAAVPLVGGCTGLLPSQVSPSAPPPLPTSQFCGRRAVSGTVAGARLFSNRPIGIGVGHGYRAVAGPLLVTRSNGATVLELDGRPALDVYLELLDAPPEIVADIDRFRSFTQAHPLVINSRRGPLQARCVTEPVTYAGALQCVANIPQSSLVWIASSDPESMLAAASVACGEAVAALGGAAPAGLLVFDCVSRRAALGETGMDREMEVFREAAGGAPVAGIYTHGEIARTRGISGFHNKAVAVVALG